MTQHSSDMVERVALKPCPRCGGPAWVLLTDVYEVWCRTDSCLRLPARATEAEAIAAWNARVEASHHAELVEEVARLRAENDRLSRAVCSGILGELLAPDENEALLAFIRDVRAKIGGDA